ncbi:HNH endonuclease [Bradyrhizobium sp. UFLA05-153]
MDKGPRIGDPVLGGRYSLLAQVKGSIGGGKVFLGTAGRCRYCRETNPARFRMVAHTFPEALGNKWVISRDECDGCNQTFSIYDDAIARAVSPFLTLGGVKGKSNKIRQTGRSEGDAVISRRIGLDGEG